MERKDHEKWVVQLAELAGASLALPPLPPVWPAEAEVSNCCRLDPQERMKPGEARRASEQRNALRAAAASAPALFHRASPCVSLSSAGLGAAVLQGFERRLKERPLLLADPKVCMPSSTTCRAEFRLPPVSDVQILPEC